MFHAAATGAARRRATHGPAAPQHPSVAGKRIVPEFIQKQIDTDALAATLIDWIKNPEKRRAIQKDLDEVKEKLGKKGASNRAAKIIIKLIGDIARTKKQQQA